MRHDSLIPAETQTGKSIAFGDAGHLQSRRKINIEGALIDIYADRVRRRLVPVIFIDASDKFLQPATHLLNASGVITIARKPSFIGALRQIIVLPNNCIPVSIQRCASLISPFRFAVHAVVI
jgi:hypothetical protein